MLAVSDTMKARLEGDTIVPWIVVAMEYPTGTRYYTSAPTQIEMNNRAGARISTITGLTLFAPPQVIAAFDTRRFTIGIADEDLLPLMVANPTGIKVTTTLFLQDPDNIEFVVNEIDGIGIYGGITDGFENPSNDNAYAVHVVSTPKLHQTRVRSTTDTSQRRVDPRDSAFFDVDKPPESLILTWGR